MRTIRYQNQNWLPLLDWNGKSVNTTGRLIYVRENQQKAFSKIAKEARTDFHQLNLYRQIISLKNVGYMATLVNKPQTSERLLPLPSIDRVLVYSVDGKGIIYLKGLRKGHYYFYLQQADPKRPGLNELKKTKSTISSSSARNGAQKNGAGDSLIGEAISSSAIANSIVGFGAGLNEASKAQWLQPTGYYYWNNPTLNSVNIGVAKNTGKVLVNTQGALALASKSTLLGGIFLESVHGFHNYKNGADTRSEVLKTTLDIEMGITGAYFPVGTAISVTYFIIDTFVGWGNISKAMSGPTASSSAPPTNF